MNKYVRVNRDWLPKEDALLQQLRGEGWPFEFIATMMNRPYTGVRIRYYRLQNGNARQHPSELN